MALKILLVDDHQLVRAGIRLLLLSLSDAATISEVSLGQEALQYIAQESVDLVLLDLSLPDISGIEVMQQMHALPSRPWAVPKIIVLSMHSRREYIVRALNAGASGYLLKESAPNELEPAIRAVMAGEQWLSPELRHFSERRRMQRATKNANGVPGNSMEIVLSPRQTEVLVLIARGLSIKEIGSLLAISAKTVETHRAQLTIKLGISDTAGLVRYAIRHGVIDA